MKRLINYFLPYDINANILILLIFVFGWFGLSSLKTTFFPNLENRSTTIQIMYPGASPEEIEEGVVLKIENNLNNNKSLEMLRNSLLPKLMSGELGVPGGDSS